MLFTDEYLRSIDPNETLMMKVQRSMERLRLQECHSISKLPETKEAELGPPQRYYSRKHQCGATAMDHRHPHNTWSNEGDIIHLLPYQHHSQRQERTYKEPLVSGSLRGPRAFRAAGPGMAQRAPYNPI